MRSSVIIVVLLVGLCAAMYFLGKKSGTTEIKASIINNQQMVKQIAELSALDVSGTTTVKLSNAGNNEGFWEGLKNYLAENTLQVTVPYHAKYGVDMSTGNIKVNENDTAVVLQLPAVKLLSFQLELDKMETMNQTGLFNRTTIADMKQAQQQLYREASVQLINNAALKEKARQHITEIFADYYKPLRYKVICNFSQP